MSKKTAAKPPKAQQAPAHQHQPQTQVVSAQWAGPLPPPGALEQFDRIIPNGAERIMAMVEQEQEARLKNERLYAVAEVSIEAGARFVGAVLVLACIGAAIWSIHAGADWRVTLGFLGVPVMGAVAKIYERAKVIKNSKSDQR